jgi:transcriptional regulator with XRE-family HTH domain
LDKSIAFQIRSLRDKKGWTQGTFAEKLGIKHQNNVSARLENPNYGKHSLTTLKKIAAACDVALVVWFIPFGRWLDWVTGTPYLDNGLSEGFYNIPTFGDEFELAGVPAEKMPVQSEHKDEFGSAFDYAQDRVDETSRRAEAQCA